MLGVEQLESAYGTTVLYERKKRKQVEEDRTKLRNRLLQLERQAHKTDKRIVQTKQRAREIIDHRQRNVERHRERERYLEEVRGQVQRLLEDHKRAKDESERNRIENETRLFRQKLALVQETRLEKREIEKTIAEQRLLERKAALEKKEEVRRALEAGGGVRERERAKKQELAKEMYKERLEQEMEARKGVEAELQRMATLELELIDQLKDRQLEQQQAYEQLQAALGLGRSARCHNRTDENAADQVPSVNDMQAREAFDEASGRAPAGTPSGQIRSNQLKDVLEGLQIRLDKSQLRESIAQLDPSGSGTIEKENFLSWLKG